MSNQDRTLPAHDPCRASCAPCSSRGEAGPNDGRDLGRLGRTCHRPALAMGSAAEAEGPEAWRGCTSVFATVGSAHSRWPTRFEPPQAVTVLGRITGGFPGTLRLAPARAVSSVVGCARG